MLKGLDPLLGPELLAILRAMGHGDELALVDANFPAAATARRLIRLDGIAAPRVLAAVLSVLPLDDFVDNPATRMEVVGDAAAIPEICTVFSALVNDAVGRPAPLAAIERFAFYQRARDAFAVIATGETRLYGNLLLRKGVIHPA
ncbi:MAG TPA: RbsD/FucU domain-containing protein [Stellaceae bacterium]|jgi:L-fucose mutarotase|nr:RbsD/FucU domain-containing protein [Stellaceae bacterium]